MRYFRCVRTQAPPIEVMYWVARRGKLNLLEWGASLVLVLFSIPDFRFRFASWDICSRHNELWTSEY